MKIMTIILVMFCLCMAMPVMGDAAMSSASYQITTTVLSGGGGTMASSNHALTGTLGQPSPLMQGDQNPYSDNYDNYPGFWYTVKGTAVCEFDFEPDGDVDGSDLAEFIADPDLLEFLYIFAADFGRTDCPLP